MAVRTLRFPADDDVSKWDVPLWITFYSSNYSTWATKRVPSHIASYPNNAIVLPYPSNFNTLNTIPYSNSPSIQMRGIEKMLLKGETEMAQIAAEGEVSEEMNIMGLADEALLSRNELKESFMTGGNVFRFDHMETVLQPGCRRTHTFVFNLIAKTRNSAEIASKIALAFQANAHPGNFTRSIYTMNHPDVWIFGIHEKPGSANAYLDGFGLTSVIQKVDINRSPIQNYPYSLVSNSGLRCPLAINIAITFVELEPALNAGVIGGVDALQIRSQKDFSRQ